MHLQIPETWLAAQVNFINHFSGCQLCTQQNKEGDYKVCEAEYTKSFEYANGVFSKLLKRMPPRDITHQMQLATTPYCKVHIPTLTWGLRVRLHGWPEYDSVEQVWMTYAASAWSLW